jgi:hypothetical protein
MRIVVRRCDVVFSWFAALGVWASAMGASGVLPGSVVSERDLWLSDDPAVIEAALDRHVRERLVYEPTVRPGPADASFLFRVADFGAVGDGAHDDGPAIRAAVAAAAARGSGAVVEFERRTYACDLYTGHRSQLVLKGVEGITIEGNGATLVVTPPNSFVHIESCRDVCVRGFVFDFTVPLHTQGVIEAVDAEAGYLDVRVHDGYPFAAGFAYPRDLYGVGAWGVVVDPDARHRKWDAPDRLTVSVTCTV